jgi:hypothetical protein
MKVAADNVGQRFAFPIDLFDLVRRHNSPPSW